ncbi:MAG: NAD(P)/FAD-dependent oxidoreductase [Gammaproteobacteria bacterium]|nr:NAD(P)/FAD-dependent oxidoreductase [Gammaproteobacteria bacterium]MYF31177.1 NAD(P)/FAD-dependent oxidoreductase [Gammaproteobacteria bacterium]MYK45454.1 NAD(P)/FAD-dependent oxidoreductase [Gammaproteobacteria bacterium]
MTRSSDESDVIVIGGGHNGLVCACYLAEAGLRVRVLERRSIVGGAAVTEEFHPGFRNSTASYTVGLLSPEVIRDLRLKSHGVRFIPRPVANFLPLADDESLTIFNDDARTAREFARFSSKDAEALPGFRAMVREIGGVVRRQMDRSPPNVGGGVGDLVSAGLAAMDARNLSMPRRRDLADLFLMSVGDLLDVYFENDHVKAALAFDAVVGNFASPYGTGTAYGLLHHALGELDGVPGAWGHAIGGMGSITQAMLAQARSLGVDVETGAEVERVIVAYGRAVGVALADGTTRLADRIAANVAPKTLYLALVEDTHLDDEFLHRVRAIRAESATLRINVALRELPSFTCRPGTDAQDHHASGIVVGPTLTYMEQAYLDARRGAWSDAPVVEMLIPSTVDDSLAPPGKHVASLFCQHFPRDRDWDTHREAAADTVLAAIDRFAPNFSDAVIAREILTPADLEARFALPGGDIFHGAMSLDQLWVNRPVMGFAAYRGPIKGLYHCGAGAHPGGGVTGLPGRNAAREILRDSRRGV